MSSIEELLEGTAQRVHFKRTLEYASKIIWKRRKLRTFAPPIAIGVVIGALSAWWIGIIWVAILALDAVGKEMRYLVGQIQLHQSMRLGAMMAVAIGDDMGVPVPEPVRKQATSPELPELENF